MKYQKPWWVSKTVIGVFVAALVVVLDLFSVNILNEAEATDNVFKILEAGALIYAFYGRLTAKTELTK